MNYPYPIALPGTSVVTGASGFIGRSLCRRLANRGTVRCISRASFAPTDERCELVQIHDYLTTNQWPRILAGVDTLVHVAGLAHADGPGTRKTLGDYRSANVLVATAVMQHAIAAGLRRVIFVSTVGVNGIQTTGGPFRETDIPRPQTPYAQSKWEAEHALSAIAAAENLQLVIVRPPLVYGPGAPGNFGRLVRLARSGMPLPFRSIQNKRSLVGLDNLVDFIATCVDHPGAANETFFVSDGEDVSTPQLVSKLRGLLGTPPRLFHAPESLLRVSAGVFGLRSAGTSLFASLQLDTSKAQRRLDWRPPHTLIEGLRRAIQR